MAAESDAALDNQVWYADSGANAPITSNAANLTTQQPFEGTDSIPVGNGTGLSIEHTEHTSLLLDNHSLHMKHILHCPNASVNLLSIKNFCLYNFCYFILIVSSFL